MADARKGKKRAAQGDRAPEFELPDQEGRMVSLSSLLSKGPAVVYFYPRDDSPGCTAEACAFRDQYEAFRDAGAEVVGISGDTVESHRAFADKHGLPFTLLSDGGDGVRKEWGVPSTLWMLPGRVTFVVDRSGTVRYTFNSQMNAKGHVDNALRIIRGLRT